MPPSEGAAPVLKRHGHWIGGIGVPRLMSMLQCRRRRLRLRRSAVRLSTSAKEC
jgi:hypothetical protein